MSAGTRSEGPTPTPEQQAVLDRIAAQRQRLRARHEARQQARAQAARRCLKGHRACCKRCCICASTPWQQPQAWPRCW